MNPLAQAALALQLEAHAVEASRIEDVRPTVDIRAYLSPAQRRVFDCGAPTAASNAGRRGGKTVEASAELAHEAHEHPNSLCVYLSLTSKSARRIMWPVLKETLRGVGLIDSVKVNEHTMEVHFPNGSVVVLAGTDDLRTIESWRGTKLRIAIVDECGSQPSFLEYLAWDILKPALADLRGKLRFIGTPSPRMTGFWYDMTGPHSSMGVETFRWTMRDNPHFPDPDEYLHSLLVERGWTTDHPTYRREYLAEWCDDPGALVYPFDRERNYVKALPTHTATGVLLPERQWRRVLGCDVGVVDACAFSLLAAHPLDPHDYVIRVEKHHGMLSGQFVERVRQLQREWTPQAIRVDTGGMGKAYAEDCNRRGVGVMAAEKREKEANIRLFRDRLQAGRIKVVEGPDTDDLVDEWATIGWDDERRLPNDDAEDHASDATLYGWRDLHNYRDVDPPTPLTTEQQRDAWEESMIKRRLGQAKSNAMATARSAAAWGRR